MSIDLRPLLPTDQPFLWEMLYQALYVPPGKVPFARTILDEPDIACYVRGWGRPGDWGLLAFDGDKPLVRSGCAYGRGRRGAMAMSAQSSRNYRSRSCRNIATRAWGGACLRG